MTAVLTAAVCCEALFVSDLQRSDTPALEQVRAAVADVVDRFGPDGCASMVAEEFGHHPDCATARMRWCLQQVRLAFVAGTVR